MVRHWNREVMERPPREVMERLLQECSKNMWHLGMWFSGELGNAGLTVGLLVLRNLFQPKLFSDLEKG